MSWWVQLSDREGPVTVDRFTDGGTFPLGGLTTAELNITYNYSSWFHLAWDASDLAQRVGGASSSTLARMLEARLAREVLPLLERAVLILGTTRAGDYWRATPGNAGHALSLLLVWARKYPDAMFSVS